jgi:hypothetical protein
MLLIVMIVTMPDDPPSPPRLRYDPVRRQVEALEAVVQTMQDRNPEIKPKLEEMARQKAEQRQREWDTAKSILLLVPIVCCYYLYCFILECRCERTKKEEEEEFVVC